MVNEALSPNGSQGFLDPVGPRFGYRVANVVVASAEEPAHQRGGDVSGWVAAAAGPDPGGNRGRRGGYAGEPDAGLRGQVSELGDVTGNAGQGEYKVLEMAITAPIATIIHATHATFFAIRAMRLVAAGSASLRARKDA